VTAILQCEWTTSLPASEVLLSKDSVTHHQLQSKNIKWKTPPPIYKNNMTFTIYCYNCSILLSIIAVNLLLCLIYKLKSIIDIYIYRENIEPIKFGTIYSFRHPIGGLKYIPPWIMGELCT
jgi:hypothetical protein